MKSVSRRPLPKRAIPVAKSSELSDKLSSGAPSPEPTSQQSSKDLPSEKESWAHRLFKNMKKAERQELRQLFVGLKTKATDVEPGIWQDSWSHVHTLISREMVRDVCGSLAPLAPMCKDTSLYTVSSIAGYQCPVAACIRWRRFPCAFSLRLFVFQTTQEITAADPSAEQVLPAIEVLSEAAVRVSRSQPLGASLVEDLVWAPFVKYHQRHMTLQGWASFVPLILKLVSAL